MDGLSLNVQFFDKNGQMNELSKKKPLEIDFERLLHLVEVVNVESEGIEPSSREDKTTDSTCLVDFNFRDAEGRQQPNRILRY